ncbi:MAG TPA: helix-turn-helix transcriptional regulator [Acidimicrobiales bacterium]|nr:helix-turn-helix transcriptional regulator [Acidimicrobiales bacterium]
MRKTGRVPAGLGRPSDALAANLRAYRLLRDLTQDELAARMTYLNHGWGRSTVSAVESRSRNVTVDEMFGLALSLGLAIGQLLDPAGPDRSRRLSLDVGLRLDEGDRPRPVEPVLARLWASSRAVMRLSDDAGGELEVDVTEQMPAEATT